MSVWLTAGPAGAATGLQSDEFNGPTLNTSIWTLDDPLGDATVSMSGTEAVFSVPANVSHDIWADVNRAPKLLQPVANTDFEIEVKFNSQVSFAYQIQGLIVQQDPTHLLRIEVHSDGNGTNLFVAAMEGGSGTVKHYSTVSGGAPVYLRLKRTGNDWTLRHSHDGSTWTTTATFTQVLAVSALGPYVGNSGVFPPAFSARIDYFREIVPDTTAPAISALGASPAALTAGITWTTNEPASSEVAYGLDTSYTDGTVTSSALVQSHSVTLQGLACGRTYHFQARSKDGAGNQGAASDSTFSTTACPTSIRSDEFNGGSLDTSVWTFLDLVGDASVSTTGTQAAISVPAGSGHDIWTGVNRAPKLLQPVSNTNFEVEAKFDSTVSSAYQLQGIIVQQDNNNLLRLEVHSDGGGTRLFAAALEGGVASTKLYSTVVGGAPTYLRVKRVGNTWTLRYSKDGDTWLTEGTFNQALNVSAIGPFAGNSGASPPAFAAAVDYFREVVPDTTPPVISALAVVPKSATAEVTWTTNEPATSEVAYGTTTAYSSGSVHNDARVLSHRVVVHGLACQTTYHFQARSHDLAGNAASSADATFTTGPCASVIASDEFNSTTLNGVWTFVDPVGDSTLALSGSAAQISVPAGSRHDLWTNVDEVARLLQSAPNANFTVEVKFVSPVTTAFQMQGVVVEQDADDLLRIETHHDGQKSFLFVAGISGGTASTIEYREIPSGAPVWLQVTRAGNQWTVRYSSDGSTWILGASFAHPMTVNAVGPFAGNSGNANPAFTATIDYFRETTDRTPPVITSTATSIRSRSAVVTWTTDELADSRVDFGIGAPTGNNRSSTKLETRHSVTLDSLACATTYQFKVSSKDALGNQATGSQASFTTAACTPSGGPDIDVWYGDSQTFGAVGVPQRWINVVGNVSDPDGVASAFASLNGGPDLQLGLGPDEWRLERAGDFNVDFDQAALVPGANDLEIRAVDSLGHVNVRHVTVTWLGQSAGATPSGTGPVLVVAAHPDDEALGMAGIIQRARSQGRRVYVAVVTNGDFGSSPSSGNECGAPGPDEREVAALGLKRDGESREAMAHLGLSWSAQLLTTDLIFLGYPDGKLPDVSTSTDPLTNDRTGLHRTYAQDFDGNAATCNGDFRYLLSGQHSQLSSPALAADLDALLNLVRPSDIYTHASFDGNLDHAETYYQLVAAQKRSPFPARVHGTIMHPEGTTDCQALASALWPNPVLQNNNPFARFTPQLDVTAPPTPACSASPTGTDWGPFGAPNELVEVPTSMQATSEAANLKWQTISEYETQIDCSTPSEYHVTCGYMRSFVKKREFFWQWLYGTSRQWPGSYTTNWTSTASIAAQSQITDGQWRFEGGGVRPITTGFDRLLVLGDRGWKDYEVTVPFTLHSSDQAKWDAGVGVALGWQGHSAWGQPRVGHPTGGLCMYARGQAEPAPFRLQIGYSPGATEDTLVAVQNPPQPLAVGAPQIMRFRQQRITAGSTRYSCKVWPAGTAEPGQWTLVADIPDWPGENDQHPGSSVLVAHNVDATFGNVTITPLGG